MFFFLALAIKNLTLNFYRYRSVKGTQFCSFLHLRTLAMFSQPPFTKTEPKDGDVTAENLRPLRSMPRFLRNDNKYSCSRKEW
jgi:hypothetical protein